MITHLSATHTLATLGAKICPIAPPGAQQYADQLMGYVLWGIGLLFILGVIVGIGATVAGRGFWSDTECGMEMLRLLGRISVSAECTSR